MFLKLRGETHSSRRLVFGELWATDGPLLSHGEFMGHAAPVNRFLDALQGVLRALNTPRPSCCAHCGAVDAVAVHRSMAMCVAFFVRCADCGLASPMFETRQEAIALWDRIDMGDSGYPL